MINFLKKNWEYLLLAIFILIAAVLRFYHINRLEFFTYDQARDALFVKRMVVDHQWRLLGTQTSLPGMYLPPFYYYTLAPVLWLFKFNPIGIDIYSAFIGVLTVPLIFLVANKIFGRPAGVFSAGLLAVSPLMVELTRRSWNPNTLPFFILIVFYFVYKYFEEKKTKFFLISFVFYGYCLSLHFGAWTLMPLMAVFWLIFTVRTKNYLISFFALIILIFFMLPLLIFDFRHQFLLFNQAKNFFINGHKIGLDWLKLPERFISSVLSLFLVLISGKLSIGYGAPFGFKGNLKDLFSLPQPISVVAQKPFSISFYWFGLIFFLAIFCFIIKNLFFRKKDFSLSLKLIMLWLCWGILGSLFYNDGLFFFYYLYLFPIPFLLFGGFMTNLKKPFLKIFFQLFFVIIFLLHLNNTKIFEPNWRNFNDLLQVANIITDNSTENDLINIATIQKETDRWDRNSVDYRYFVETFGKRKVLDWFPQDYEKAQGLFVVDETGKTDVLNSPIMEIQSFKPEKVIGLWPAEKGIIVYKLGKKADD